MYNPYLNQYPINNTAPMYSQPQTNGLISVRSVQEAMNYPVAPGNSVTFKDEGQPYVYVKTMGFNQMEQPTFKRYRLVEEELNTMPSVEAKQPAQWVSKTEFEELQQQVTLLRDAFNVFTDKEAKDE